VQHVRAEAPYWGTLLPQIPRLVHRFLNDSDNDRPAQYMRQLMLENRQQTTLLAIIAVALISIAGLLLYRVL
jgi:ubiquinone biosynthesis protein